MNSVIGSGPARPLEGTPRSSFLGLILWDCSLAPKKNDRLAKLGASPTGHRGVAVSGFDPETKEVKYADGFGHRVFSRGRIEPDNHVFLNHGGLDMVWAHRYIVDHENPTTSIKHRSTIGVNQKGSMCWWYSQDLEWGVEIEEVGPPVPKGREFNGAGFLSSLYGSAGKNGKFTGPAKSGIIPFFQPVETKSNQAVKPMRATRCLNNNMRGGYFTDGKHVAQLRQLFHMMPLSTPPRKGPRHVPVQTPSGFTSRNPGIGGGGGYGKHPGQIDEPVTKTEGQRQNELIERDRADRKETTAMEKSGGVDGDCMVDRWVAAMRGDHLFDVLGKASALAFEDVMPATGDDLYYGAFFLGLPSSWGPKHVPAEDVSSDQPIFETPNAERGIRPFIRIPKGTGVPECEFKPHFDPTSPSFGDGEGPPAHTGTGADTGEWLPPLPLFTRSAANFDFAAGSIHHMSAAAVIPPTAVEMGVVFKVPYTIPTNLAGAEVMDFRFFYRVVLGPGQTVASTWTELTAQLAAGDNPSTANEVKELTFKIPRLGAGMGGGRVHYWFMRRSDDTAPGPFRLVGNVTPSFSPWTARPQGRTY